MTPSLEESRTLLLDAVGPGPVRIVRPGGNLGDRLIDAGQAALLGSVQQRRIALRTVVGGSGGWCRTFHGMPRRVRELEGRGPVIVLPSTFEVAEPTVEAFLRETGARLFVREERSLADAAPLHPVTLAHCPSFFFDFAPYRHRGRGVLDAFRQDREASGLRIPARNIDLSRECRNLREWLETISAAGTVRTDRAHVMIAAALMGKRVRYRPGSYFKVEALASTWLTPYDVEPL